MVQEIWKYFSFIFTEWTLILKTDENVSVFQCFPVWSNFQSIKLRLVVYYTGSVKVFFYWVNPFHRFIFNLIWISIKVNNLFCYSGSLDSSILPLCPNNVCLRFLWCLFVPIYVLIDLKSFRYVISCVCVHLICVNIIAINYIKIRIFMWILYLNDN